MRAYLHSLCLIAWLTACSTTSLPPATVVDVGLTGVDVTFNPKPDVRNQGEISAGDAPDGATVTAGDAEEDADASLDLGAPGETGAPGTPCEDNATCFSGQCVPTPNGPQCAATCNDSCPQANFKCTGVTTSSQDIVNVCVPRWPTLCNPCGKSMECKGLAAPDGLCVDRGAAGFFCGAACQVDGDCPATFSCQTGKSAEGTDVLQCMPAPGTDGNPGMCTCSEAAKTAQLGTICHLEVKDAEGKVLGSCKGSRVCDGTGLTACSAAQAASETCNGEDDDCNGQIDEAACDDANPCSQDACDGQAQVCSHAPAPGSCDADANACTEGDTCQDGKCQPGKDKACDDGNPCTIDACNPATGCTTTMDDGAPCSDDDACTLGDACQGSACQAGAAKTCSAKGACLSVACDPATGQCVASNLPDATPCDDGTLCTAGDACTTGACTGKPAECDDNNPCTVDGCNGISGCTHMPFGAPCDDGNACTISDTCTDGACAGTVKDAKACDDGLSCTSDSCDPAAGCAHGGNQAACDDGNPCSVGDICKDKACLPGTNTCACGVDSDCAGQEDGNLCNGTLFCNKSAFPYACKVNPMTVVTCAPGTLPCATNACLVATGKCGPVAVTDGKACDADGSVCTADDACAAGACKLGPLLSCDDGNPCTNDACASGSGCTHLANAAPCDADGSACTVADKCAGKVCLAGAAKVCDDSQDCTIDGCDVPSGVCVHDPKPKQGVLCDADGSVCTGGDACAGGTCQPGSAVSCDDVNPCTTDACSPTKGCTHAAVVDQTSCDAATWCMTGSCVKKPVCVDGMVDKGEECDDGNAIDTDACSNLCKITKPVWPLVGELLVTEVMPQPNNSNDKYEWFELYNPTDKTILLGGLWYGDLNYGKQFSAGLVLKPKAYFLLAATQTPGGPVPNLVYGYSTAEIALANSDDGVAICKTASCGSNFVDAVAIVHYVSGKNGWKTLTKGRSYQLDPLQYSAAGMADGVKWCLGTASFGTNGDQGSPGVANDSCP